MQDHRAQLDTIQESDFAVVCLPAVTLLTDKRLRHSSLRSQQYGNELGATEGQPDKIAQRLHLILRAGQALARSSTNQGYHCRRGRPDNLFT